MDHVRVVKDRVGCDVGGGFEYIVLRVHRDSNLVISYILSNS